MNKAITSIKEVPEEFRSFWENYYQPLELCIVQLSEHKKNKAIIEDYNQKALVDKIIILDKVKETLPTT